MIITKTTIPETKVESITTKLETIIRSIEGNILSPVEVIQELRRQVEILNQLNEMFDLEADE